MPAAPSSVNIAAEDTGHSLSCGGVICVGIPILIGRRASVSTV